jgi:uncharacterized hydrophobic protein (TIGR00271 family)
MVEPSNPPQRESRLESWPQAWARAVVGLRSVSAARRADVLTEIHQGSQATTLYYILLGISELIAGFALIINSDATLIGANVVAPLMTPIFGVSLGLMRGDLKLLRAALVAEFGGALLGVGLCFLLGLMPLALEPSAALLSQTRPTLIDLMVAALAGFAGVLAIIDERVSPALPGVAIATALNPPIAAIGLCLAYGAYSGAWGAFLLFFANVLAILAVAAVLFLMAGFVTREEIGPLRGLVRRFAAAGVGLMLVTGLLTTYLVRMVRDLRMERTINSVLDAELAQEPGTSLVSIESNRETDAVEILSTVLTPRVLIPERVKRMEDMLTERLGEPVRLFVRCSVTKDVAATGSTYVRPYFGLRGRITGVETSPDTRLLLQAEQLGREIVASRPDLVLTDVELLRLATGPVLVFSIQNPREPSTEGVRRFEEVLRARIPNQSVRVVVRTVDSADITSKGRILFGAAHFGELTASEVEEQRTIEDAVKKSIESVPGTFVTAVDAVRDDIGWAVRTDVVGPRVLAPAEVRKAEERATAAAKAKVAISARTRAELFVSGEGYSASGAPLIPHPTPAPPSAQ